MLQIKCFNSLNTDFSKLDSQLDDYYYQQFGEIALKYHPYNKLDDVMYFFVAYYGNKAVGCACIKRFNKDTAELKRVFVDEMFRRKNIAKKLVYCCENKAKELGFKNIVLETGAEMNAAIGLYQKLNYLIIENFGQYANDEVCVCMKKEL